MVMELRLVELWWLIMLGSCGHSGGGAMLVDVMAGAMGILVVVKIAVAMEIVMVVKQCWELWLWRCTMVDAAVGQWWT